MQFAKPVRDAPEQIGKMRIGIGVAKRKRSLEHDWLCNTRELRSYVFGATLNLPNRAKVTT
jgi:hypothetical protein